MSKILKSFKTNEDKLYSKILLLSRNKLFYTKLCLNDTFQNRINLIFLHLSFIFILIKNAKNKVLYKEFYQRTFDFVFKKIEINMREIGYSDTSVNKNMKFLVKVFYNILLNCEKYKNKTPEQKKLFIAKYLALNSNINSINSVSLVDYFNKYLSFCLDLPPEKVLNGDLKFIYK